MSIQKGFCAKPRSKTKTANEPVPKRNSSFRPSRSASWPAASWKAPDVSVEAAAIHEISLWVMPRSRPMEADTMEEAPTTKVVVDMAMAAWPANDTSCSVFLKHAGRWPRLCLTDWTRERWLVWRSRSWSGPVMMLSLRSSSLSVCISRETGVMVRPPSSPSMSRLAIASPNGAIDFAKCSRRGTAPESKQTLTDRRY